MRSGVKVAIVGGVFVVVAGGVAYGGYNLWQGVNGGSGGGVSTKSEEKRTGPVTADEVNTAAKEFLAAWAAGEPEKAGQLTNNPVDAGPVVADFGVGAKVSKAEIVPGTPVGPKVPFTVKATVTYEGESKPWTYTSELTVVRGISTGRALVDWKPAVIHPKLTANATLHTGPAKTGAIMAVDRKGVELTAEKYPSLGPILDQLREKYAAKAGGQPGVETWIESGTDGVPNTTLITHVKGKPGRLETTIDAQAQAAAEKAVKQYGEASVVAVKPSTGEIRAVANAPSAGFNAAFEGKQAPGSTWKIVTAALLLEKGLVTANGTAECPQTVRYYTRTFHNLDNFALGTVPFKRSFAKSCNTAFIKLINEVDDDSALGKEARDVFGIGLDWKTGIVSSDGSVPEETQGAAAEQYIGQGTVQMNALNIASVTATAKYGTFKQPFLVSQELDGRPFAKAARSLSPSVSSQLRAMMRAAATGEGTAAAAMASVGGEKGAKTGSAEVDGQATSNSWFTGYSDDLSAAAVVQSGGHGGDAAGKVVASVLRAG